MIKIIKRDNDNDEHNRNAFNCGPGDESRETTHAS